MLCVVFNVEQVTLGESRGDRGGGVLFVDIRNSSVIFMWRRIAQYRRFFWVCVRWVMSFVLSGNRKDVLGYLQTPQEKKTCFKRGANRKIPSA
jgi:hypothetical protein